MSHRCGRALPEKVKILNFFNKQSKKNHKSCCSANSFTADSKNINCYDKTHGQPKMKRLKTRKERSRMRGGWKETSHTKLHHHHCHCQASKDMAHFQNCCQSHCHCPERRDAPFPSVGPAAQETSIITDSRLIGHHGLFNHEVKSIDIERLLSEQRKLEKSRQHREVKEKSNVPSHLSPTSHIPAPCSSDGLLAASDNVSLIKKADPTTKAYDDCQDKEQKNLQVNSHGSDVTPGQKPQRHSDLSPGSCTSELSSKQGSLSDSVTKTKNSFAISEKSRESQLTPVVDTDSVKVSNKKLKRHMISTHEQTPKIQDSPVHLTPTKGLGPSPLLVSSSPTADSFEIQHRRQDPEDISMSVSTLAARLCDYLQFPHLRRRNLVSESREVLLKSLRERHGPWLQENLLGVQRCLNFGMHPTKVVQDQDQEPIVIDEDELFPTGTSVKMTGSGHFNWKTSPPPHQNLEQTAEWLSGPADTSVSLLDDIPKPCFSPKFRMDFEPSGPSATDLFAPSPTLCRGEEASGSEHWEDSFNRSKRKESVMFDSFENSFMNYPRHSGPQYHVSNIQPFFSDHSVEPMHFPQKQDAFDTDRYSFASSSTAQIHHPHQRNHSFTHFQHPSTYPPLSSHLTDMMHFPPSHMLERAPTPPPYSLPSPEHWSFPPMRLY